MEDSRLQMVPSKTFQHGRIWKVVEFIVSPKSVCSFDMLAKVLKHLHALSRRIIFFRTSPFRGKFRAHQQMFIKSSELLSCQMTLFDDHEAVRDRFKEALMSSGSFWSYWTSPWPQAANRFSRTPVNLGHDAWNRESGHISTLTIGSWSNDILWSPAIEVRSSDTETTTSSLSQENCIESGWSCIYSVLCAAFLKSPDTEITYGSNL